MWRFFSSATCQREWRELSRFGRGRQAKVEGYSWRFGFLHGAMYVYKATEWQGRHWLLSFFLAGLVVITFRINLPVDLPSLVGFLAISALLPRLGTLYLSLFRLNIPNRKGKRASFLASGRKQASKGGFVPFPSSTLTNDLSLSLPVSFSTVLPHQTSVTANSLPF